MRIAYLVTTLGMGGAERQALALAERMARRGHAVKLLVLLPRVAEPWPTALEAVHLGMGKTPRTVAAAMARARRVLREFQPEILHSHCFHSNMSARALKLLLPSLAVISTVHNVYEGAWPRMTAYTLTDALSRRTAFVCEAGARRYRKLRAVGSNKCEIVPNGIDAAEFAPDPERRKRLRSAMDAGSLFIWLTAGRISPAKDYPNLLRAFAILHHRQPDSELWIAGEALEDAAATRLRSLASELGLEGSLRWLGLRRDVPALLDAADGFVLGSAWEGMPLAVAEAMAMRKPVVATDVGGVRELAGGAGLIVPAKNSSRLAEAMLKVAQMSTEKRETVGRALRARVAGRFTVEANAEAWERIYENVLGRDSR